MSKHDKAAAQDMMINHYNGLEPGNEQKEARLAFAKSSFCDGKGPDYGHMQFLDFDYHRGDAQDSAKIGRTVTVSRVRPPPEVRVQHAPRLPFPLTLNIL